MLRGWATAHDDSFDLTTSAQPPCSARPDFEADADLGVIADLVGDLEHGHEAGVHADEVHLPPEPPVGVLEHALQLPVVEAVGLTRFDFVGTRWL